MSSGCKGKGIKNTTVKQKVTIAKGTNSGSVVKISKMGSFNGDLLVNISVKPHPYFNLKGFDIHTDKLITISQAVLGGSVDVETLYGKKSVKIMPGTASG